MPWDATQSGATQGRRDGLRRRSGPRRRAVPAWTPWVPPALIPPVVQFRRPRRSGRGSDAAAHRVRRGRAVIYDPPITVREPVQLAANLWVVSWISTHPGPFYLYVDGEHVLTTRSKSARILAEAAYGEHPIVDVATTPSFVPPLVRSARMELQWDADPDAEHYNIEQWSGSAWIKIAEQPRGPAAQEIYRTAPLADDALHRFRVKAIKPNQTPSAGAEFEKFIVRAPDPPGVTLSYNDGAGTVTIE